MNNTQLYETSDKWTAMQVIVSQHTSHLSDNLTQQFSKMVLLRFITENALIFLLQFCGLMFSTFTPIHYPIWLATGTACAFIFMRGYSVLLGIFLGTFVAYSLCFPHSGFANKWALLLTFQAVSLFWLVQKTTFPTLLFYKKSYLVKFIGISTVITGLTSFLLASLYPVSTGLNMPLFLHWWLSNLNGIFIIAIALITLDAYFPEWPQFKRKLSLLSYVLFLSYMLLLIIFLIAPSLWEQSLMASLLFIAMLFISFKYGRMGHMISMFLLTCLFFIFINFSSSFSHLHSTHFFFYQLFILLNGIVGLIYVL